MSIREKWLTIACFQPEHHHHQETCSASVPIAEELRSFFLSFVHVIVINLLFGNVPSGNLDVERVLMAIKLL